MNVVHEKLKGILLGVVVLTTSIFISYVYGHNSISNESNKIQYLMTKVDTYCPCENCDLSEQLNTSEEIVVDQTDEIVYKIICILCIFVVVVAVVYIVYWIISTICTSPLVIADNESEVSETAVYNENSFVNSNGSYGSINVE